MIGQREDERQWCALDLVSAEEPGKERLATSVGACGSKITLEVACGSRKRNG
jgi:hypothetical protein